MSFWIKPYGDETVEHKALTLVGAGKARFVAREKSPADAMFDPTLGVTDEGKGTDEGNEE